MRVFVGERDHETGEARVWVVHELPRPDISEIVDILGDLNKLMELRRDGSVGDDYERHRAETIGRKDAIVAQLRAAEEAPPPVELVHRTNGAWAQGFDWGDLTPGAADLARSILTCEIGETAMPVMSMKFVSDVLSSLDHQSFRLPATDVWTWIEANRSLVEHELFETLPAPDPGESWPSLAVTDPDTVLDGSEIDSASGSAVVRACEQAWADIQENHPDLPDVVVILGTGIERGRLVKLGHWWSGRWIADGEPRGEVLLAGEALHLSPDQVFEVLLHEAAHGLNAARRIPDTSRGGRYHNRRFAVTAEEVMLEVELMPPYGFASTKLSPAARDRYSATIDRLGDAIRIARHIGAGVTIGAESEGELGQGSEGDGRDTKRKDSVTAVCGCDRRFRMAPSVYEQGPVICGVCGSAFRDVAERELQSQPDIEGQAVIDSTFLARRRAALEAERSTNGLSASTTALVHAERARLAAAVAATASTDSPRFEPLRQRLERIDRLLYAANDRPPSTTTSLTAMQHEGIRELLDATTRPEDVDAAARWYETFGTINELPMPASERDDERLSLARALLKADGTLHEPRLDVGNREMLVGERVITTRDCHARGIPGLTPGTVEQIDDGNCSMHIDFATWGRLELSVAQMLDAGITHDYVATDLSVAPQLDVTEHLAVEANRIDPGVEW